MKRAVLILATCLMLLPIYLLVAGAFMDQATLTASPPRLLPIPVDFSSFLYWAERAAGLRWFVNTGVIVGASVIGSILVNGMAGYSFGVLKWRGQKVLFWIFMGGMMVPGQVMFVARFVWFYKLGIMALPAGLIIMYVMGPASIFLICNFIRGIPKELRDTARIDGCGEFRTFIHVMLPLSIPIIGVIGLFTALGAMGDYLWQMILTENTPRETLIVGIQRVTKELIHLGQFQGLNVEGIGMAGGVILAVPILILFYFSQRHFKGGLILGSVKD